MDGIGPYIGRGYYAEVFEYGEGRVIKLFDDGRGMEKAELEARITNAARESGIPAPEIWEATSVNGRAGIVMERIEGETMLHWGTSWPWRVYTGGKMMARLHAGRSLQPWRGHSHAAGAATGRDRAVAGGG